MKKKQSKSAVRKNKFAQVLSTGADQRAAAIAAGYKKGPGIDGVASRLTRDPAVVEKLNTLRAMSDAKAVLTRERALEILTAHAEGDMTEFLTGNLLDLGKAQKAGKLGLVKAYSLTEKGVKVELYSVQTAIDQIAKMQGWNFADNKGELLEEIEAILKEKGILK